MDACQRWLENNSRLKEVVVGNGTMFQISYESQSPENSPTADSVGFEEDADDELQLKLSDKDLRCVFCGLVKAAKKEHREAYGHSEQRNWFE